MPPSKQNGNKAYKGSSIAWWVPKNTCASPQCRLRTVSQTLWLVAQVHWPSSTNNADSALLKVVHTGYQGNVETKAWVHWKVRFLHINTKVKTLMNNRLPWEPSIRTQRAVCHSDHRGYPNHSLGRSQSWHQQPSDDDWWLHQPSWAHDWPDHLSRWRHP
mgnify:CR=1 FL=1